jgi:flagellar biosynthesis/type III secretory pathway chaperone
MEETSQFKLISSLEILAGQYKDLLELLRREKDLLIGSDYEKLILLTKEKEMLLSRIRAADMARERYAQEMKIILGLESSQPRLIEIIEKLQGRDKDRLQSLYQMLVLLVERAQSLNRENEVFARSGLDMIDGAFRNLKETLNPQKTYGRNKQLKAGSLGLGNLSEREA